MNLLNCTGLLKSGLMSMCLVVVIAAISGSIFYKSDIRRYLSPWPGETDSPQRASTGIKVSNDVHNKLYGAFGDQWAYIYTGYFCSDLIESYRSKGMRMTLRVAWICLSAGLRPWGMNLFVTIPHFITSDPILIHHIRVMFNLICSFIVGLVLIRYMSHEFEPTSLRTFAFILVLAASLVPHITTVMSDLISFTFFVLGLAYLRIVFVKWCQENSLNRIDYIKFFLSGLMCGISVTMKQNYFIITGLTLIAFFIVYRNNIFQTEKWTQSFSSLIGFMCGFAFVLTQFFATWTYSGYFFLFDPTSYQPFSVGESGQDRKSLELIAYYLPTPGTFVMSNDAWLNPISFFLVRLYLGMSKLHLPIYHGFAPIPIEQHISVIKAITFFAGLTGFTLYCYKTLSKELKALALASFFITIFTAYAQHVENRYYLGPRLIYLMLLVNILFSFFRLRHCLKHVRR